MTTEHIGIVACSAPGAALCYETLCADAADMLGGHHNPEVSLHTVDFEEHVRCMERDDWEGVAMLLFTSAKKLAAIGADFVICPDNTAHIALEGRTESSPLPWLHIAAAVADAARMRGYRRVGILGTRYLVESSVYPDRLQAVGVEHCLPRTEDRKRVNEIIFSELVHGRVSERARADLLRIIDDFRAMDACDAVVLGCTELPLAVGPESSRLPTLDSTRLLARAALNRATNGSVGSGQEPKGC